jgi:hypothetical protein
MKTLLSSITDTRMVYLVNVNCIISRAILDNWNVVIFVTFMLNVGVWTGFCPSKWFFENVVLGFKNESFKWYISKVQNSS